MDIRAEVMETGDLFLQGRRFKYSVRISNKSGSAGATGSQRGFETISCGFQKKIRLKRGHFFLAPYDSGGGNIGLEVGRDFGRRELIEPMLVSRCLELPFLHGHIDDKPEDAIKKRCDNSHLGNHGGAAQRPRWRRAQNGIVILESAVGSFRCRSQAMQLAVTVRASGDFQQQARVHGNRDMGGKTELFRSMGTVPVQFEDGRVFGFHTLLETGKGKPLSGGIPSIGTRGKVAVGNERPAVAIVASLKQGFAGQFFIPGIVVDQRNGALLTGKFVIMQLIIFGVHQMNPGIDAMEAADLFLQRDELIPFLGVAGNGEAANGKFDAQLRFNRGRDDGVIAEDLFGLVGVGGLAAHADASVPVVRKFGTAEAERIGCFSEERGYGKIMDVGLSESQNQSVFCERFLDPEEFEVVAVDDGEVLSSVFEGERKDRDFGAFDVLRKVGIRAFGSDAAFLSGDNPSGILDPVKDPVVDFLQDVVDRNRCAGIVEVTAAAVTGGGGKQGAISGLDAITQQAELFDQGNEGMEDLLVTALAQAAAEVGEGGATGDGIVTQPGIAQDGAEVFAIDDLVEIAAEVKNEQRDGIVARGAEDGVGVGGDGADERKIHDRSNQLRESATDGSVVVGRNKLRMELIPGEPAGFFLGKRLGVSPVDSGIDFLELCDYIVNRELGEINHLISSRVSREAVPPSNTLSGNPFLFSGHLRNQTHIHSLAFHGMAPLSSHSMKVGDAALRSCSQA